MRRCASSTALGIRFNVQSQGVWGLPEAEEWVTRPAAAAAAVLRCTESAEAVEPPQPSEPPAAESVEPDLGFRVEGLGFKVGFGGQRSD